MQASLQFTIALFVFRSHDICICLQGARKWHAQLYTHLNRIFRSFMLLPIIYFQLIWPLFYSLSANCYQHQGYFIPKYQPIQGRMFVSTGFQHIDLQFQLNSQHCLTILYFALYFSNPFMITGWPLQNDIVILMSILDFFPRTLGNIWQDIYFYPFELFGAHDVNFRDFQCFIRNIFYGLSLYAIKLTIFYSSFIQISWVMQIYGQVKHLNQIWKAHSLIFSNFKILIGMTDSSGLIRAWQKDQNVVNDIHFSKANCID